MEDREEHSFKSMALSAGLFATGYNLKNNYLKNTKLGSKKAALGIGAAFSLIPVFFNDEQDKFSSIAVTAGMTLATMNSGNIKKVAINQMDLFEHLFRNLKKLQDSQNQVKEFFIESKQKLFYEREKEKGFLQGVLDIGKEVFDKINYDKSISKSKAYNIYKQISNEENYMTLEEFNRLGKKVPYKLHDYVNSRRRFEKQVANINLGSGVLSTLGYFSKVENGRMVLNAEKYLSDNANNIKSKIDILDSLPSTLLNNNTAGAQELLSRELNRQGLGFFVEALERGEKTNDNQVTYRQFMNKYGTQLFNAMGGKANKYFDKDGNARYMDILGDQVFSDNLGMNDKGKLWDTTWLKPTNYALDILKMIDNSFRPFFKSLPFGENKQFPIMDTFGLDTRMYNSIYGNPMSKLYISGDNIDLIKTKELLDRQVNRMRRISDPEWRKKNNYKTISQALSKSNEIDNIYNPRIKTDTQLREAIRMLEIKQTQIEDQIVKTGGTLNKSNLVDIDMDKAYNKYFIHVDKNNLQLMETTEDKINTVFFDNRMFVRKGGSFEEQKGQFVFDLSRQTRIIQAKRNGEYYTNQANRVGKYIEKDETPLNFEFKTFKNIYENKGSKEALNYVKNSDLNAIPGFGRNAFKDSDNVLEDFMEPINRVRQYLKINGRDDRSTASIGGLLLGFEKQDKTFYDKYTEEVSTVFGSMIEKYKTGMNELADMINNNSAMLKRYYQATGSQKVGQAETYLAPLTNSSIKQIVRGAELTDNMKDALKMQRAFEMSMDKYKLTKDYKSIMQIGTGADIPVQKRLGDLFNVGNLKEDIVINTFGQGKDYKEFVNSYGEMLEDNIMFHKDTLFNKNRITNINSKAPSIVKRAFTGMDYDKTNKRYYLTDEQSKMGTNLGMFVTKGLESFENTLSTIGVPKLNTENMSNAFEYFANVYTKRILPFHVAVAGYGMLNSAVDAMLPDSVPIFGQGITSAAFKGIAAVRMGIQLAINGIGLGAVFRKIEEMFPGMLTDNGLLSPLQLSATNEDMYAVLYEGKEIEDKKNRFWYSSGRQKFEGGEVQNIRPSLLYLGQHRTAGIYENKIQRFFRQDFLPTKIAWTLVDPYMEERINSETRPVAKSSDMFNSELPIIGGFINLLGKVIKPTKYFNEEEWKVSNGIMKNPAYDGQENTPEYLRYDTTWKSTEALVKAFEDTQSIFGMRGYLLGQGYEMLFGKNDTKNQTELETLNDGQSLYDRYYSLNLGGLFGTTEPIRRLIGNKPITNTISPLKNNSLPDWMPQNYFKNVSFGNVYNEIPFGEFILPGKVYEQYNKLHPDDTGDYGVADRLKILSKVAPFSKEFRHTRDQALRRIDEMSREEKQIVYQALSYAEKWRQRDIVKNERQEMDTEDISVTVKRMESPFEFYGTDNRRYKLSGVGLDFFDGRNSDNITADMEELQAMLRRGTNLNGFIASNPLTAVKTDNAGEYIELYVPEFDKLKSLRQESYLRYSIESDGDITDTLYNAFRNAKKPAALEKVWGSKDTYYRYYYENILDPAFKNWEQPVESFINPMLDTASSSFQGYVAMLNTSRSVGEFGDPLLPGMLTAAYLKGIMFGPNDVNRIERENYLKNLNEYAKSQLPDDGYRGNFNSSIYNMEKYDGLSKMKNYLTATERKYLDDIANEINPEKRERLYEVSSDRMKMVLNNLWERQAEYLGGEYNHEDIQMPTYDNEDVAEYNATNDTSYNDALFKYEMGFDLTSYEEEMIAIYGTKHLKEYRRDKNIAEYIDNMMGKGNNQKVLSTTMGEDMLIFGY